MTFRKMTLLLYTQPVRENNYCMVLRPLTSSDGDKLNNPLYSNISLCVGIHKTLVNTLRPGDAIWRQ